MGKKGSKKRKKKTRRKKKPMSVADRMRKARHWKLVYKLHPERRPKKNR